jgi:hypothetical protein
MRKQPVLILGLAVIVFFCSLKVPAAPWNLLAITDESLTLKRGKIGTLYEFQFQTEGGLLPLTWKVVEGQLPPGLELLPSGMLRGIPNMTQPEPYIFEVEVSDSSKPPQTYAQRFVLPIQAAPLRIVNNAQPLKIVQPDQSKAISPLAPFLKSTETSRSSVKVAGERFENENTAHKDSRNIESTSAVRSADTSNASNSRANTPAPSDISAVNITIPLREGRTIRGKAELATPSAPPLKNLVEVYVDGDKLEDKANNKFDIEWDPVNPGVSTRQFTITFKTPIVSGSLVKVIINGVASISTSVTPAIDYDWGRVRAYFSGGVVFSKERGEFKDQDLAFGFNLDKNWYQGEKLFKAFNTFFETRLTTIPVPAETKTEVPGDMPTETKTEIDSFLASKKSAMMQIGAYAPMYAQSWRWHHDGFENALFVAPLLKAGILTISNNPDTAESKIFGGDDVFNFKAGGFRLGHYKLLNDKNQAPELISYLDITLGKWENFEVLVPKSSKVVVNTGAEPEREQIRKLRWGFEGRLRVPFTPLQIGFDANLGKGRDDVRFIFGTRFDIGTLFAKIKLLQELGIK